MTTHDTEITLGTGKILSLFFGLVIFSAVIFGLGYTLGRSSARPTLAADPTTSTVATTGRTRAEANRGATNTEAPARTSDQMSFYKSVGQKDTNSQLAPAENATPKTEAAPTNGASNKEPQAPDPSMIGSTSSYFVQVAAVSKHEDAEALVDALKKKQYPALISNASASDKLFRVQVGPYSDAKDAEVMRTKLVSDGYNPILKK